MGTDFLHRSALLYITIASHYKMIAYHAPTLTPVPSINIGCTKRKEIK